MFASIVINAETLELYRSQREVAKIEGVSVPAVLNAINSERPIKGTMYAMLEDWQWWSDREKEKFTRKNNIYFLRGEKL
jgi:transcription initiation factor TFIIIB Brf1 subunit/transcription initiation factor TFIIB